MANTNYHETFIPGGEPEAVFPIPCAFRDPAQVSAAISVDGGGWIDLLPGLEYIVNRISDCHGELILLGEELREGKTLRLRVAEAEGADAGAPVPDGAHDCGKPCALLAEVRNDLVYLRNDTSSRLADLEWRAAEGRLARRVVRRLRCLVAAAKAAWRRRPA